MRAVYGYWLFLPRLRLDPCALSAHARGRTRGDAAQPGLMALITLGITDYVRFVVSVIRGNPFQTLFGGSSYLAL